MLASGTLTYGTYSHESSTSGSNRETRVLFLAAILALLNWFDMEMTLSAFHAGVLYEANPIAEWVLKVHGALGLRVFKASLVLLAVIGFFIGRRFAIAEIGSAATSVVYACVAVAWMLYPIDFA